ncbi:hypothetical protein GGR56DRAFT_28641 [Xylariaceae sp. FL0804]|nr:hypothetical protein GGR56DRAFT_28641 [Xylariaceae sp. FL0804]
MYKKHLQAWAKSDPTWRKQKYTKSSEKRRDRALATRTANNCGAIVPVAAAVPMTSSLPSGPASPIMLLPDQLLQSLLLNVSSMYRGGMEGDRWQVRDALTIQEREYDDLFLTAFNTLQYIDRADATARDYGVSKTFECLRRAVEECGFFALPTVWTTLLHLLRSGDLAFAAKFLGEAAGLARLLHPHSQLQRMFRDLLGILQISQPVSGSSSMSSSCTSSCTSSSSSSPAADPSSGSTASGGGGRCRRLPLLERALVAAFEQCVVDATAAHDREDLPFSCISVLNLRSFFIKYADYEAARPGEEAPAAAEYGRDQHHHHPQQQQQRRSSSNRRHAGAVARSLRALEDLVELAEQIYERDDEVVLEIVAQWLFLLEDAVAEDEDQEAAEEAASRARATKTKTKTNKTTITTTTTTTTAATAAERRHRRLQLAEVTAEMHWRVRSRRRRNGGKLRGNLLLKWCGVRHVLSVLHRDPGEMRWLADLAAASDDDEFEFLEQQQPEQYEQHQQQRQYLHQHQEEEGEGYGEGDGEGDGEGVGGVREGLGGGGGGGGDRGIEGGVLLVEEGGGCGGGGGGGGALMSAAAAVGGSVGVGAMGDVTDIDLQVPIP